MEHTSEKIKVTINGFEYTFPKEELLKIPYFQSHEKYNQEFRNKKEIKIYNHNLSPSSLNDLINYINGNIPYQDPLFQEKIKIAANSYGYKINNEKSENPSRLFM